MFTIAYCLGVFFDRPDVVARAETSLGGDPVAERMTFQPGDFFEAVTGGGGGYVLRHILHDWGDDECVQILSRCRSAMSDDTKLLVMEEVIPDGNVPSRAKWLDVCFLACWTGKERTKNEYAQLYAEAGFELSQIIETESPLSIVEGVPV